MQPTQVPLESTAEPEQLLHWFDPPPLQLAHEASQLRQPLVESKYWLPEHCAQILPLVVFRKPELQVEQEEVEAQVWQLAVQTTH